MTVYDNGGECLGDGFIGLKGLQQPTKESIHQLVYLDKTFTILNEWVFAAERKLVDVPKEAR